MSNWRLLTDPAAMVKNAWKTSARNNFNMFLNIIEKFSDHKFISPKSDTICLKIMELNHVKISLIVQNDLAC
jgi:hypothetical protein